MSIIKLIQTLKSWWKTSKKGLKRPAARYDGIGKIGGGYGKACCKACCKAGLVEVVGVDGVVGMKS